MTTRIRNFFSVFLMLATAFGAVPGLSATAQNPRGNASGGASGTATASRNTTARDARHAATTVVSRGMTARPTAGRTTATGAITTTGRTATRMTTTTPVARTARAASTNAVRAATAHSPAASTARSAARTGASRAGMARATAVFSDISKIGGGYANCREAYATCMDQFCANANDTYRRCFCSERFAEFRDSEAAMDQAKELLMRFQDVNLDAVDKTAAEVNAMYTATAGEQAIKNDVSGAAQMLVEITELLSGKKKAIPSGIGSNSLGILSFDLSVDIDDIWNGGTDSLFGNGGVADMTKLEGTDLFNAANKQCLQLVNDACESSAVLNMARSAYGIMISQDCNAYEKKVESSRETLQQTVRTAEKYLREARLDEYRSHNSADVNECITKVRSAIQGDAVCGANYARCLDYTGVYINSTTGEPRYSTRLFELTSLINLGGVNDSRDVLQQNPQFNNFLETRRSFAAAALDTCRDQADFVWNEFKRTALIEIAQAQDEKIESVKMSCVSTMAECYDTQTSALRDFDTNTAQVTGALTAYASRDMCADKVTACAALYGDTDGCKFDKSGKLTNSSSGNCGLQALLTFVDTVDNVRVGEGCKTAVSSYAKQLCTPTSGTQGYPWKCHTWSKDDLKQNLEAFAARNCSDPTQEKKEYSGLGADIKDFVDDLIGDITSDMENQLSDMCESLGGYWAEGNNGGTTLKAFYSNAFGGNESDKEKSYGVCLENSTRVQCLAYNDGSETTIATYDRDTETCTFSEEWYKQRCAMLGAGYWENGVCYQPE